MPRSVSSKAVAEPDETALAGMSASKRARGDVAKMARAIGLDAKANHESGADKRHVFIDASIPTWNRVVVHRGKFQFAQRMAEARAFARMDDDNQTHGARSVPVVFHKRPAEPYYAILEASDYFALLKLASDRAEELSKLVSDAKAASAAG